MPAWLAPVGMLLAMLVGIPAAAVRLQRADGQATKALAHPGTTRPKRGAPRVGGSATKPRGAAASTRKGFERCRQSAEDVGEVESATETTRVAQHAAVSLEWD